MVDDAIVWLASYAEDEQVSFRIGRLGDELIAQWVGLAELRVARDGSNPRFTHRPDAFEPDITKIREGSVRLLLRHLAGELAMHGAAVAYDGNAVVLLGRGGQGKSTLAAALCARGCALLSDDAVALATPSDERRADYRVEPFERNHWLEPASVVALGGEPEGDWKAAVPATKLAEESARLVAFVDLTYDDALERPQMREPDGAIASFQALVPQVVRFVVDEGEPAVRELDALAALVTRVPVLRLARPRALEHLAAGAALVLDLLTQKRYGP